MLYNYYQPTNGSLRQNQSGAVLVVSVLVLMIGTIAAVAAYNTTNLNTVTSKSIKNKIKASYGAEKGIYKMLSVIRSTDFYTNDSGETDKLYGVFDAAAGDDVTQLSACRPNWSDLTTNHGTVTDNGKVMCNAFGDTLGENIYVSVRRDADYSDNHMAGVYLVTSSALKVDGSVEVKQAVILLPLRLKNFVPDKDNSIEAHIAALTTIR